MPAKKSSSTSSGAEKGDRLQAVLAYVMITAPIILFTEKKDAFVRFHATQALAAGILFLIVKAATLWMWWVAGLQLLINLGFALLLSWIAIGAAQGKKIELPVLSDFAKFLKNIFKL